MSEYSIVIEVKGDGSNSSNSGAGDGQGATANLASGNTSETGKLAQGTSGSALKSIKGVAVATGAVAMATKVLNYKTSRVYTETGNRQLQDNINATKEVAGQVATVIGGFVAGGVIGGMLAIGGVALNYALQYESYNFAKQMESTTLAISRQRMGVGGMAISRSRASNQ